MGRALRSISMRIRGYSEESEDGLMEVDEELKNISGDLIDLTKTAQHTKGISVFKEGSTTEFKSLIDYLGEVREVWDEMSQAQQNAFLQKAFAKTQAQAGAALIQNYDQIKKAQKAIEESEGSATREMDIIRESLDFRINKLRETWVSMAQTLIDRGTLGKIVDALTSISEVIGKIVTNGPALASVIGAVTGGLMSKNGHGRCKSRTSKYAVVQSTNVKITPMIAA